jgi:hypothetical protein
MAVKVAGSIPAERNGLQAIAGQLVSHPDRQHIIVAVIDVKQIMVDTDTEVASPTVRLRHVEVVGPESAAAARAMMQRAMEARTGEETLPFPEPFGNVVDFRAAGTVRPGRDDDD